MKKILQQIANTLLINTQHVDNLGLLHGKMGIALFLYHYAHYCDNKIYSEVAGNLVDEVYNSVHKNSPVDFADGLTGIGWGLLYLIENKFVEGDPDEVMEEVDRYIIECMDNKSESSSPHSLFGQGIYFLSRTKNKQKLNAKEMNVLDSLLTSCRELLSDSDKKISLSFLNSVLFFLTSSFKYKLNEERVTALFNSIPKVISETINNQLYTCADLKLFLKLTDSFADKNRLWVNTVSLCRQCLLQQRESFPDDFTRMVWQQFIYFNKDGKYYNLEVDIFDWMSAKLDNLTSKDLAIEHGLAGIGLGLIQENKEHS